MKMTRANCRVIGIKTSVVYFTILAAFFLILRLPIAFAATLQPMVSGTYTVTMDWGDGNGVQEIGVYDINTDPGDPLAYNHTESINSGSSSAAFAMWGNGDSVTQSWSYWLTDGTGVGQNDPEHNITDTKMTFAFDLKVTDLNVDDYRLWTSWYDQTFLKGTVGGLGSYAGFSINTKQYTGTNAAATEDERSSLEWSYYNDTPGDFYIDSGAIFPTPDYNVYLEEGDYMRFVGEYIFYVNNDGGPSSINFTPNAPPPVPEPSTIFLFGFGMAAIAGFSRKK